MFLHGSQLVFISLTATCCLMLLCSSQLALYSILLLILSSCTISMVFYRQYRGFYSFQHTYLLSLPHSQITHHNMLAFVALSLVLSLILPFIPFPGLSLPHSSCYYLSRLLLSHFCCYCLILAVTILSRLLLLILAFIAYLDVPYLCILHII